MLAQFMAPHLRHLRAEWCGCNWHECYWCWRKRGGLQCRPRSHQWHPDSHEPDACVSNNSGLKKTEKWEERFHLSHEKDCICLLCFRGVSIWAHHGRWSLCGWDSLWRAQRSESDLSSPRNLPHECWLVPVPTKHKTCIRLKKLPKSSQMQEILSI